MQITIKRIAGAFIVVLLLEGAAFAMRYQDLLFLRHPVPAITAGQSAAFAEHATAALTRPKLTTRHLETIAAGAQRFGLAAIEVQALERRFATDGGDVRLRLRLADALRRAGRYADAERHYTEVLAGGGKAR